MKKSATPKVNTAMKTYYFQYIVFFDKIYITKYDIGGIK